MHLSLWNNRVPSLFVFFFVAPLKHVKPPRSPISKAVKRLHYLHPDRLCQ